MKSRFSWRSLAFSPLWWMISILLQRTIIGMPRLTLRTPSASGISSRTSNSSALISESTSSTFLNSSFLLIIRLPLSSIYGSSHVCVYLLSFSFILSRAPWAIFGCNSNRLRLSFDNHCRRLFMISKGSSKSKTMTAAVLSSWSG